VEERLGQLRCVFNRLRGVRPYSDWASMHGIRYFAYGTTQKGFLHHRRLAHLLGEPIGRFRTAAAHAVVVPYRAACGNPGCQYVHRMAALVPGVEPLRVEGDLFLIDEATLAVIDRLELGDGSVEGPYVRDRITVVSAERAERHEAVAYIAREPARWRRLVMLQHAEAREVYPPDLAVGEALKDCCVRAPGHAPPHDVVDPLRRDAT
jgi:gamma-glutamylcyclotransferase (GGCT)/AIG2-like uncharacterized protein YtfP